MSVLPAAPLTALDSPVWKACRADFPILESTVQGHPLAYLDNAATTQKPRQVIAAVKAFEEHDNANIHRGVHELSVRATEAYEGARHKVAAFVNARSPDEIVFTSGTTAGINLVAQSYGGATLKPGDEILLTEMEHHSNLVPWQLVRDRTGAAIRVIPVTDAGTLDLSAAERLIGPRTRILALAHASNVLGTVNPVRALCDMAHERGAVVLVDGAQSAGHMPVDVQAQGCDFFVCSAHKMLGPTGVGVLYGRGPLLERMPPWQGGGGMIASVTWEVTTFAEPPHRFEAGTPPIAQAIGLGAAVDYLSRVGLTATMEHERRMLAYALDRLRGIRGLSFVGAPPERIGVISFTVDGVHPHDVATIVNANGVAVRAGHHCAQPLMRRYGVPATVRASFALYNNQDDVDALVEGLDRVVQVFRP